MQETVNQYSAQNIHCLIKLAETDWKPGKVRGAAEHRANVKREASQQLLPTEESLDSTSHDHGKKYWHVGYTFYHLSFDLVANFSADLSCLTLSGSVYFQEF